MMFWKGQNYNDNKKNVCIVLVSFNHNLTQPKLPGERVLIRNYTEQVGLWACLWGVLLIDVGSPSPLWVVPFPSQEGPEPQKKGQSELSASKDVFILSLSLSVDLM